MQRNSQRSSISLSVQNKLPSNFAEQVMELELQIQVNPKIDMEKVNRLVELYSAAVEYYESIKSNNFIVFKNKIIKLMMKPSLDKQSQKEIKSSNIFNLKNKEQTLENKRQQLQQTLQVASSSSQLNARRMMLGADTKLENVTKKIGNEIQRQQSKIQQRLRMRKGKVQIISISSTQGDPKQKQFRDNGDIFCFQTILESNDITHEDFSQQNLIRQQLPKQSQPQNIQIIQVIKKPLKPRSKKAVLTIKPNEKVSELPIQYIIPF